MATRTGRGGKAAIERLKARHEAEQARKEQEREEYLASEPGAYVEECLAEGRYGWIEEEDGRPFAHWRGEPGGPLFIGYPYTPGQFENELGPLEFVRFDAASHCGIYLCRPQAR